FGLRRSSSTGCSRYRSARGVTPKWMKSRRRKVKRKVRPMRLGEPARMQADINITPLVDVVLVLLIIFMVVVPLLMEGYDVDIPRASADTSAPVAESQLILGIGAT